MVPEQKTKTACYSRCQAGRQINASSSILQVGESQNSIIETYLDDFSKYATRTQVNKLRLIFHFIPKNLGEKVKYSEIDRESKSRDLKKSLELLILARIIIPPYHSEASGIPLEGQTDESILKCFFLDIGLVTAILNIDPVELIENQLMSLFEGKLAEQFVAQHFYYQPDFSRPRLHYWLRDRGTQKAELDFVIDVHGKVLPCEVKSSEGGRLKSLIAFMLLKNSKKALKLDLNLPSLKQQKSQMVFGDEKRETIFELESLPVYSVECIKGMKEAKGN